MVVLCYPLVMISMYQCSNFFGCSIFSFLPEKWSPSWIPAILEVFWGLFNFLPPDQLSCCCTHSKLRSPMLQYSMKSLLHVASKIVKLSGATYNINFFKLLHCCYKWVSVVSHREWFQLYVAQINIVAWIVLHKPSLTDICGISLVHYLCCVAAFSKTCYMCHRSRL